MTIYRIENLNDITSIGASEFANKVAIDKSQVFCFRIDDLSLPATHILKQESISVGGDFITPKDTILSTKASYSGILIATKAQMERLIQKCKIQPFGLKNLSQMLTSHINAPRFKPKIMGIINITDDSFYAHSRITNIDKILQKVQDWIDLGVDIIDIGGASSRPGSEFVDSSVEIERIKDAVIALQNASFPQKVKLSIDSYNAKTIRFCIERGFHIINDVYSLKDENIMALAKDYKSEIILMHNSWIYPHKKENIIIELDEFFAQKLEILDKYALNNIILDIGFGFGKNNDENLELIRNLRHFQHFGCEILVGASRKKTLGEITQKEPQDRLAATLALHQRALENGANIIRCHDVEEHIDMVKILGALH